MKKILAILMALAVMLSLCACGSSAKTAQSAPAEDYDFYDGYEMEIATEEAANSGFSMASGNGDSSEAPDADPDKIIYSADVTLETTRFDDTLNGLDALIRELGGWVEASSISGSNYYNTARGRASTRSASYTLRIPGSKFSTLMNSLSTLGNVPYSHTYTENVTAQYYDVQARLTAYKTQETRLLEMMEVAESVEDIILLEDRLTELRYEIESLQSTLNNWDRRVSYSTVYLSVEEVQEYTPETVVQPTYGQQLVSAFHNGLAAVGSFFRGFLLVFLACLPTLVVIAVVGLAIVWIVKAAARRKEAKRAAKAQQNERQ